MKIISCEMVISVKKAAAVLGRKGGKSKSEKKQKAARENGKKGGRPNTEDGKPNQTLSLVRWEEPRKSNDKSNDRSFDDWSEPFLGLSSTEPEPSQFL